MALTVEAALAAIDADAPDAALLVALAKWRASDTLHLVSRQMIQLHGGIGMTWEAAVHTRLKRAKSDQLALGTPDRHRSDLAALVDLPVS